MQPYREHQASSAPRHHVFDAVSEVEIDSLGGSLIVKVGQGSQIIMDIDGGSEDHVRAMEITTEMGALRVSDQAHGGGDTNSIHISGSVVGSVVITGGGSIVVNGRRIDASGSSGPKEEPLVVTLTVPLGTALSVDGVEGPTTVGNTEGSLDATLSGVGNLTCGSVKKTKVKVSGSAHATFASVTGDFEAKVSGTGSVTVKGGAIDTIEATVSGTGNITVSATANQGALKVSGVGNIHVSHMRRAPRQKTSGIGSITVGRIG